MAVALFQGSVFDCIRPEFCKYYTSTHRRVLDIRSNKNECGDFTVIY